MLAEPDGAATLDQKAGGRAAMLVDGATSLARGIVPN